MYFEVLKYSVGKRGLAGAFLIAFLYIAASVYLLNYRLFLGTLFGDFPLNYKITLLLSLLPGIYTAMSTLDFYLILFTSVLVGLNLVLLFETLKNLRQSSNVGLVVGGSSIVSIAAVGCTTCGLTFLSILGLSSVLTTLPFDGLTVHLISLVLLVFSTFYMLKKLAVVCKIPPKK